VVSTGFDKTVRLWKYSNPSLTLVQTFIAHDFTVCSCASLKSAIDPQAYLLTASADGSSKLFPSTSAGKFDPNPLRILEGHDGTVWGCTFLGNEVLLTCGSDGSIRGWKWRQWKIIGVLYQHVAHAGLDVDASAEEMQLVAMGVWQSVVWALSMSGLVLLFSVHSHKGGPTDQRTY
jgi:WD40 repeat protein